MMVLFAWVQIPIQESSWLYYYPLSLFPLRIRTPNWWQIFRSGQLEVLGIPLSPLCQTWITCIPLINSVIIIQVITSIFSWGIMSMIMQRKN